MIGPERMRETERGEAIERMGGFGANRPKQWSAKNEQMNGDEKN